MSSTYGSLTGRFVRATGVMLLVYAGLILLTTFQISRMSTGFIPDSDIGYLVTIVQLPPGSSLERTDKVVRQVNDIALNTPGVLHTGSTAGFDVTTYTVSPNVATVFTSLPSLYGLHMPGVNAAVMVKRLQERFKVITDANAITVMPPAVQGLGSAGGFKLMLEDRAGLGPQALAKAANDLVAAANKDKTFEGTYTLFNAGAPSLDADIDRLNGQQIRLTPTDIFSTMQLYMGSQYVNDFNFNGRTYPVYVQGDEKYRRSSQDIAQLKARNASGEMVPLGTVVTFTYDTKPYRAPRSNLYPPTYIIRPPAPRVSSRTVVKLMEQLAHHIL